MLGEPTDPGGRNIIWGDDWSHTFQMNSCRSFSIFFRRKEYARYVYIPGLTSLSLFISDRLSGQMTIGSEPRQELMLCLFVVAYGSNIYWNICWYSKRFRYFPSSFLPFPWRNVLSHRPYLADIPIEAMADHVVVRWPSNWGYPAFSWAVRQISEDLCTTPVFTYQLSHPTTRLKWRLGQMTVR